MQHTFIFIFVSSFSLIHSYLSFHVLSFFFFSFFIISCQLHVTSFFLLLLLLHILFQPSPFFFFFFSSPFSSSFLHPLSFFHFLIFISPLPFFHLSPIPHSCKNQSHWRFCGDFCDYSDCDLLYFYLMCIVFYCIHCIPIFQHHVCKWVRTPWWALMMSSETKPFGDLTLIWFHLCFLLLSSINYSNFHSRPRLSEFVQISEFFNIYITDICQTSESFAKSIKLK